MRTIYADPQSPLISGAGYVPPDVPIVATTSEDDWHFDGSNIRDVKLRAIRSYSKKYPTEALMLERSRFDGWSVRDLSEVFGGHPGTVCRRLARYEERLRVHVLADVAAWSIRNSFGFTVSPQTADLVTEADAFAVSLQNSERTVDDIPDHGAWSRFIGNAWNLLCAPYLCEETGELRPTYLGGYRCRRTAKTFMDVQILVSDRDLAMEIGTAEHQQFIYDLRRDMTIQL
ncbi:hypothetical protein [Aporhodopirellula aestuarii]|uniref:Uncharacterized protein n=1 Tax=Aporhodopirellula aestuarii TaxID=2950107 RepID=A0ABT0U5Z7_9BACT|nr:hypothetical protein [Aporhodopirellula aestuarii]MCM2372084.1 hypothetical protein [Aporhodopirellula aestuarii]